MDTPVADRRIGMVAQFRRFSWLLTGVQTKEVENMIDCGVKEYMREQLGGADFLPALEAGPGAATGIDDASGAALVLASASPAEGHSKETAQREKLDDKKKALMDALFKK